MRTKGERCKLSELKIGQVAIVEELKIADEKVKGHLLDMGLTRGVKVKIKKIAPMGDPIDIELRGYELAMRKRDLEQIQVIIK